MRVLLTALLFLSASAFAQVAIQGKKIYTMAGEVIENGTIILRDGKIEKLGPSGQVTIPDGAEVYEAEIVTPGLVDAHTVVGLAGYLNQDQDQDQLEKSGPIQPELRAIDAYNAREFLVGWLREHGVTTIHTGHGPGALVSGQTLIAKTAGETVDEAVIVPEAMIAVNLGRGGMGKKTPGTRAKQIAMLRAELIKAQEYAAKHAKAEAGKEPARNLRMEILVRALEGKVRFMVYADRAQDIISAMRLAKEFGLDLVLDSAAEVYLVADQVKQAGIPVILHPTMKRTRGDSENLSMGTAANLEKLGIPFALQSGFEGYVPKTRVVLFEAAIAARFGLAPEKALASITIDAARILGVDDRVGSLEVGKDADLVLFDGDPFEYTSHVTGVFINGHLVSDKQR